MARFTTAPVNDVIPSRKQREPSQRAQVQKQYQDALRDALLGKHEALVIELEPGDKPLTIRSRLKRAADALGLQDVSIRRKKQRIIAYQTGESGQEES